MLGLRVSNAWSYPNEQIVERPYVLFISGPVFVCVRTFVIVCECIQLDYVYIKDKDALVWMRPAAMGVRARSLPPQPVQDS